MTGNAAGRVRSSTLLPALLLCAMVLAAYWPVSGFGFVVYDDYSYVTNNPVVQEGLTARGVSWAFTAFHAANWHPATWISHMLDVTLFGLDAGRHHLVSLLIHLANVVLLFLVLRGMTGATWRSFAVAALFGVHPLHVESVAWVAQRKDVLSGFFWILAMGAWLGYVRRPGTARYLAALAAFALGLLCKPMAVTLPFALLLLDWWPLGRMGGTPDDAGAPRRLPAGLPKLFLEKVPFAVLSALSAAVTFLAQKQGGAMDQALSLWARVQNAAVAYATYLFKTVAPVSLAVLYPHPGSAVPAGAVIAAVLLLSALSVAAVRLRGRRPHLLVGWLWYLGTLVPVIGLVQVGVQSLADRYTYIPLVGIFIALAWEADALRARLRAGATVSAVAAALVLSALVAVSAVQVRYWRDSVTLFRHALAVEPDNWVAHLDLGWALEQEGRYDEAMAHYRASLAVRPRNPYAHNNLGYLLELLGRTDEAVLHYREALRLKPGYPHARKNLERILGQGRSG